MILSILVCIIIRIYFTLDLSTKEEEPSVKHQHDSVAKFKGEYMVNRSYSQLGGPCLVINVVNIGNGKELVWLTKLYCMSKWVHYPTDGLQRNVPLAGGAFSFSGMGTGTFSSGFLGTSGTLKTLFIVKF